MHTFFLKEIIIIFNLYYVSVDLHFNRSSVDISIFRKDRGKSYIFWYYDLNITYHLNVTYDLISFLYKFKNMFIVDLTPKAVVYAIPFRTVRNRIMKYIIMTKRKLKEHKTAIKFWRQSTTTSRLSFSQNITISFDHAKIIFQTSNCYAFTIRESIYL